MDVCVLASSSSGNAIALRADGATLLVDAGLSARAIGHRLEEIGWPARSLVGMLISHEHRDHCRGVSLLSRRYGTAAYGTAGTFRALEGLWKGGEHLCEIETGVGFDVGPFRCEPFTIPHDVADPAMFVVRSGGFSVGVVTDLGRVTSLVRQKLATTDLAFIEANHDADWLRWGEYPWSVKQRISSQHGHLDNDQAAGLAVELADSGVGHLVFGHLSPNHNKAERVAETVGRALAEAGLSPRVTVVPAKEGTGIISPARLEGDA